MEPVQNCLQSVTGERLNMLGKITLKVKIGNQDILQLFYVAEINETCILGLDFLCQHRCQLNLTDGVLSMGTIVIPLLQSSVDGTDMLLQTSASNHRLR
jgi:hypothetical protein